MAPGRASAAHAVVLVVWGGSGSTRGVWDGADGGWASGICAQRRPSCVRRGRCMLQGPGAKGGRSAMDFMPLDTLGIEPRASHMLSGCDTTTPRAHG